jgi:hypothetical protein
MSVEKGPKTGPAEFAGVDISNTRTDRNDSVADTLTPGDGEVDYNMPKVDLEYAATLRPSRVSGDRLLWYITFVCGTGVGHFLRLSCMYKSADISLSVLDMIKVYYRLY